MKISHKKKNQWNPNDLLCLLCLEEKSLSLNSSKEKKLIDTYIIFFFVAEM
jgi:hypothetical protein